MTTGTVAKEMIAMTIRAPVLAIILMLTGLAAQAQGPEPAAGVNDYPTAARAEYVFACMTTNGQTQEALTRCACAIDTIAAAVPYDAYEKAETILRMRHEGGGYLAQEFRVTTSNNMLRQLQEAQAEADVSCF
jgi:acetyl esterase/lipase